MNRTVSVPRNTNLTLPSRTVSISASFVQRVWIKNAFKQCSNSVSECSAIKQYTKLGDMRSYLTPRYLAKHNSGNLHTYR